MDQIGFKNFRRFSEHTSLDLGKLNIFVGTNNSGKSSAIKACILAQMNINRIHWGQEIPLEDISFENVLDAHLHLDDFVSNLSSGSKTNEMEFSLKSGNTSVHFVIDGSGISSGEPSLLVPLKFLEFKNILMNATIRYEFVKDAPTRISLSTTSDRIMQFLVSEVRRENFHMAWSDNAYEQEADMAIYKNSILYTYNECKGKYSGEVRNVVFSWEPYEQINHSLSTNCHEPEPFDNCRELLFFYREVRKCISRDLKKTNIQYIEAHNAPHNEILYEEDKNNYLAQTVAKFISSSVANNQGKRSIILKWMKELHIGEDYRITRPFPEVLKVDILSGERWESLGKMGTGSVQLFILLLRMAMAEEGILLIEEPEQNLHPALQSKLADMFLEFSNGTRTQVFLETHSEYLVRKTQVIVHDAIAGGQFDKLEANDLISVYYFPTDSSPYSLRFRSDGIFVNEFGPGFFDCASNLVFDIL